MVGSPLWPLPWLFGNVDLLGPLIVGTWDTQRWDGEEGLVCLTFDILDYESSFLFGIPSWVTMGELDEIEF
jgi:hypothetical protein